MNPVLAHNSDRTASPRTSKVSRMLHPRSVAVVGVSADPNKVSARVASTLIEGGYEGDLYFVNPNPGVLRGIPFTPSLSDIGKPVDLVIVAVPAQRCTAVVEEAARLGCGASVVLANGFAESGRRDLQDELVEAAQKYGMPVVGPNCLGLISGPGMVQCLPEPPVPTGRVAIVAQSGGVGAALYSAARTHDFGLSYFVSMGNQADVRFDEILDVLAAKENSDVVLLYVESFQDINRFLSSAGRLARQVPVVLLRGGKSDIGSRVAASHTGAMADDGSAISAALAAAGILEVDSTEDLVLAAQSLSTLRMKGRAISVIGDSGGYGALAADSAERSRLEIPAHDEITQRKLQEIVDPRGTVANPVDTVSGVDLRADLHEATVEVCLSSPGIDAVAFVGGFGGYSGVFGDQELAAAHKLVELRNRYRKPIVVQSIYAGLDTPQLRALSEGDIPVVEHTDQAMRILGMMADVSRLSELPLRKWHSHKQLSTGTHEPKAALREDESRAWLSGRLNWQLPESWVVNSEAEAIDAAARCGGPAVMKVLAHSANHKSDSGGVVLNIRTPEEIRVAWQRIESICQSTNEPPKAQITKFAPGTAEAMVGVSRHEQLGPLVLIGTGGVLTEAISDRVLLLPPFTPTDVITAVRPLSLGRALSSRRAAPVMLQELAELAAAVGELAHAHPELEELDLNPVSLTSRGAAVLDARVVLREDEHIAEPE